MDDGARIWIGTTIDDEMDRIGTCMAISIRARTRGSRGTNRKWRVTGEDGSTKDAVTHDVNRARPSAGRKEDAGE